MGTKYTKPHLSFDEQLARLESRGLMVTDRGAALRALREIGYYRLSAYLHTLRAHKTDGLSGYDDRLDTYVPGSTFELAIGLWRFDRRLRLDLLDGLEQIEVALRTSVAYQAGKLDAFVHHKPELLAHEFTAQPATTTAFRHSKYDEWLIRYLDRLAKAEDEAFVRWFAHKYEGLLPIWVATEVLEFGQTSRLVQGLPLTQRRAIAADFGVNEPKMFTSWIASLNGIRNVAAHHSRLWNRSLVSVARRPTAGRIPDLQHLEDLDGVARVKVYVPIAILVWLLRESEEGQAWRERLLATIETFPELPQGSLQNAGFPDDWRELSLWR